MGRRESVRIVAVVEDRQLERFVRKTLAAFGFDRNKIRVLEDYPKGGPVLENTMLTKRTERRS